MVKIYSFKNLSLTLVSLSVLALASCKKDHKSTTATPTQIGVYAYSFKDIDATVYRELGIAVSKIGTQALPDTIGPLVYDTGSGGMVIDASSIIPSSMISSSGFVFSGDSTIVNGITITNQTGVIEYGADDATANKVYGNLAYAAVTVGDENGNIVVKRLPFFLYYKAVDEQTGTTFEPHYFDVFGVSPEYDIQFASNAYITSPFSYFDPGTGLTKGFKMQAIAGDQYSSLGTYVSSVTLGLTANDVSGGSGFNFTTLSFYQGDGYAPIIPSTITYNGTSYSGYVLFDTGTEPYSYLEDPTYPGSSALLADKSSVSVSTTSGFSYSYTVANTATNKDNLTYVENAKVSGGDVTIFGLEDFFFTNEYMIDFADHKLGLKNN